MTNTRGMQEVKLETLKTPRTVATDFVLRTGLNFRAGTPTQRDGKWRVPLRALIPASPDVLPRKGDQLFFRFDSFAEVVLDSNLRFVEAPRLSDLNENFQRKLSDLFAKIEKMILDYGDDKWGRIPGIRFFLNPLNAIVSEVLSLPIISKAKLEQQEYLWYADLLMRAGFLEEDIEKPDHLHRSNELVALAEKNRRVKGFEFFLDETIIDVLSIICSKYYDTIKERNRLLPSYVDTTVAYYVKAIRMKQLMPMTLGELEYAYNVIGRRDQDEKVSFSGKVADLVTAGFLQWFSQGVVIGVEPVYSRLQGIEPEIEGNLRLLRPND